MNMATELTGVIKDALRLHPADRAQLIDALYTSLESEEIRAREKAWAREAESRLDAYNAGEIESKSWDELKSRLRKRM
jgi:putative addiction module component (TIGR02574 family)